MIELLIIFLALCLSLYCFTKKRQPKDRVMDRIVTIKELAQHNGRKDQSIWVGVKDLAFDVSENKLYYPNEKYCTLAGHDISLALAKIDFTDKYLDKENYCSQLSKIEQEILDDQFQNYLSHYKVVGKLVYEEKVSKQMKKKC